MCVDTDNGETTFVHKFIRENTRERFVRFRMLINFQFIFMK